MADFRNLVVWQKANKLSVATAEAVEGMRGHTGTILRRQLLRSIFSIQANIAEGSSKRSDREFARYVRIALGSSTESANHLILVRDLELMDDASFTSLSSKIGRGRQNAERPGEAVAWSRGSAFLSPKFEKAEIANS